MHNSQWIPLPTQLCLVLYSFSANLLHLHIMCLIISCLCGTMRGIRFCGCGWVPVRGFICLSGRKTNRKGLCTRFSTRPEEDEERQGLRAVYRSQGKATVRKKLLLNEELGPVEPEDGCSWLLWGNFREHARDRHRSTECEDSVKNLPLQALGASPCPCLFVLLSSTLSCVLCACKAMGKWDERNHKTIEWPWADLWGWDSGRPAVGVKSTSSVLLYLICGWSLQHCSVLL